MDIVGVLAWPGVVVLLGFGFLLLFWRQIAEVIARSQSWRIWGASIDTSVAPPDADDATKAQQKTVESNPEVPRAAGNPLSPMPPYDALEESTLRQLQQQFPGDLERQLAWAIRLFAVAHIERINELIYRISFGSQLFLLKELNVRGSMAVDQVREIYKQAADRYPELYTSYSFEQWGRYLIRQGLVTLDQDPPTPTTAVQITPLGRDFVVSMARKGLPELKYG